MMNGNCLVERRREKVVTVSALESNVINMDVISELRMKINERVVDKFKLHLLTVCNRPNMNND